MIRGALPVLLALGLAACVGAPERDGYLATYDALAQAQAACAAKGGTFRLKVPGEAETLDAYACERK